MCNVYLDKEKHSLYGGFIIRGKKIGEYSPFFLKILLNNSKARKSISSLAGGSTRFNVSQDILKVVGILVPKMNEQIKIGDFFSKLNQQIELEEQKLEKLEEQKKGYMQKIFLKN
ncbi:restriction endonuclease subunit S [Mammaliicoccus sciuri]